MSTKTFSNYIAGEDICCIPPQSEVSYIHYVLLNNTKSTSLLPQALKNIWTRADAIKVLFEYLKLNVS